MKLKYSDTVWTDPNGIRFAIIAGKFFKWYLGTQGTRFHNAMIPSAQTRSNVNTGKNSYHTYRTSNNREIRMVDTPIKNSTRFITGLCMFLFTKAYLAPGTPTFTDQEIQTLKTRAHDLVMNNLYGNRHATGFGLDSINRNSSNERDPHEILSWSTSADIATNLNPLVLHNNRLWMSHTNNQAINRAREPGTQAAANTWEQIGTVWNNSSTYEEGNLVYHKTFVFRAKKAVPANIEPGQAYNEYWTESAIANQGIWGWQTGQWTVQHAITSYFLPDIFADWEKAKLKRILTDEGAKKGTGEVIMDMQPGANASTISPPTKGIVPGGDPLQDRGVYVVLNAGRGNRSQWEAVFTQENGTTALGKVPAVMDIVKVKANQQSGFTSAVFGNAKIALKGTVRQARSMGAAGATRAHLIFDPGKGYEKSNPPIISFTNAAGNFTENRYLGVNDDGSVYFYQDGGWDVVSDSNGESFAWDAWTTEGVVAMMPNHEDMDKWRRTRIARRLAHRIRRQDLDRRNDTDAPSNKIVDGNKVHEYIGERSATPGHQNYGLKLGSCAWHYLFGNHQYRAHTTYNTGSHRSSFFGALYAYMNGENDIPEAYYFNAEEFLYAISRSTRYWVPENGQFGPNDGNKNHLRSFNTAGRRNANGDRKTATEVAVPNRMFQDDGEVNWQADQGDENGRRENYWVYSAYCALCRAFGITIREYSDELTVAANSATRAATTGIHAEPTEDAVLTLVNNEGDEPGTSKLTFAWDDIRGLNNYNGTANISTLTAGKNNDYLTGTIDGKTVYILRKSPAYANYSPSTSYSIGAKVRFGGKLWTSLRNNNRNSTPRLRIDYRNTIGWTLATEECVVWALVVDPNGGTTRILFETDNIKTYENGFLDSMERMQRSSGVLAGTFKVAEDNETISNFDVSFNNTHMQSAFARQGNCIQNMGMAMLAHYVMKVKPLPPMPRFVKERQ